MVPTVHASKHGGFWFKPSPYRSKRLHKKLLKRFGAQVRPRIPCMLHDKEHDVIYAHPECIAEIQREMQQLAETNITQAICGGWPATPPSATTTPEKLLADMQRLMIMTPAPKPQGLLMDWRKLVHRA